MIEALVSCMRKPQIWDGVPVYCYTFDIDWCSEIAIEILLDHLQPYKFIPTFFVTHASRIINQSKSDIGIHPNFLNGSSHGNSFKEVVKTCMDLVPDAECSRSHRAFQTTETSHLLYNAGIRYASDIVTIMQPQIKPILHESGIIKLPVFWEDGTHLRHNLRGMENFDSPGLKIINVHPMHFVINTPYFQYMRDIKDSHYPAEYQGMDGKELSRLEHKDFGIADVINQIFKMSERYCVMSMKEIYEEII